MTTYLIGGTVLVMWTILVGFVCYRLGWYRGVDSGTEAAAALSKWFEEVDFAEKSK